MCVCVCVCVCSLATTSLCCSSTLLILRELSSGLTPQLQALHVAVAQVLRTLKQQQVLHTLTQPPPSPRDTLDFTSLFTAVVWRPNNLPSLGSANLNSTSVKDASFAAAAVFALVVTVAVSYGYQQGDLALLWTGIAYCIAAIVLMLLPIVKAYAP